MDDEETRYRKAVMSGHILTDEEASVLEDQLRAGKAALETRFKLLGYFDFRNDYGQSLSVFREELLGADALDAKASRQLEEFAAYQDFIADAHAALTIWFIENMPEMANLHFDGYRKKGLDEKKYNEVRNHWLTKVAATSNKVSVVEAAAKFFEADDQSLAESLYRQLSDLEPGKAFWQHRLARLLGKIGGDRSADALSAIDCALLLEPIESEQLGYLETRASLAFNANNSHLAQESALRSLGIAATMDEKDCGDTIHNANTMLGRIALKKGDLTLAAHHLQKAAQTKGSAVLGSFGPDLKLAEQLYDAGQHECVVAYLIACKAFWRFRGRAELIDRGVSQIKAGIRPCFLHKFATYGCKESCTCITEARL